MASLASYDYEDNRIQSLMANGFLRDVLNADQNYNDIISVIILYYRQGFAKYYDSEIDRDYKEKMKFGDIVKIDNEYIALDINDKFTEIGAIEETEEDELWSRYDDFDGDIDLKIPLSICTHLTNAISFYSKLNENTAAFAKEINYQYSGHFNVKHDDGWIIDQFGGSLNSKIEHIAVKFKQSELSSVWINFGNWMVKEFYPQLHSINYKDIDEIYKIRENKNNLVKSKVTNTESVIDNIYSMVLDDSTMWFMKFNFHDLSYDFTGPETEKDAMMNKLETFYTGKGSFGISLHAVDDSDVLLNV